MELLRRGEVRNCCSELLCGVGCCAKLLRHGSVWGYQLVPCGEVPCDVAVQNWFRRFFARCCYADFVRKTGADNCC